MARDPAGAVATLAGETMGTRWSVRAVSPPASAGAGVQSVLDGVVAEMSHWLPGSDLGRFNRSPPGQWRSLPANFATVLEAAIEIARTSGGAFDPAMGTLVDLWGFGPTGSVSEPPDDMAVTAKLAEAGHRFIELDMPLLRARRTARATLDLSGIAKGFAVDRVVTYLRRCGVRHFLVEVGGELCGVGLKPDGQPWWVDLEAPPGLALPLARIALHELSVATSGDYRRAFAHDGRHYAHSLDPRTGRPIANGVRSVTVLHQSCMRADAWATALTVLGAEAGMALAEAEALSALMIVDDRELLSPALARMLD